MWTLLGAGGAIGNELVKLRGDRPLRLVSRHPQPVPGMETVAADLADPTATLRAVDGSEVVILLAGLKYDLRVWRELWPRIMRNTIAASQQTGAKLIFFDNLYMYGRADGPMTEETPFAPISEKGRIRATIATELIEAYTSGKLTAMIARSADFYGPDTRNGVPNILVFEALAKGGTASWLVNDQVPHSYTFTPDAAKGLLMLGASSTAWNQTWHLPTAAPPPTGREFVAMAAEAFGVAAKHRVLARPLLKIYGWFNSQVGESYEMLYQNEYPYIFDSSKFARAFGFAGTPYREGIRITAQSFRR